MNEIEPALRRAYALGQKYWQQADSDFARDHRKADETQAKFNQLVESMQGWLSPAEADNLRAQLAEAQRDAERWLRAAQCTRLDQFGGFVITPDEPAFAPDVSLAFTREIDVAIDAAKGEPS